jgi:hypothetical protein
VTCPSWLEPERPKAHPQVLDLTVELRRREAGQALGNRRALQLKQPGEPAQIVGQGLDRSLDVYCSSKPQPDGTLVKALTRAWRWQRMLDEGVYATVSEIGAAENIAKSYVSRVLRLALLAPDLVEAILGGSADQSLMPERLERPLPASWDEQRRLMGQIRSCRSRCGQSTTRQYARPRSSTDYRPPRLIPASRISLQPRRSPAPNSREASVKSG